jgi:hypothetical protein
MDFVEYHPVDFCDVSNGRIISFNDFWIYKRNKRKIAIGHRYFNNRDYSRCRTVGIVSTCLIHNVNVMNIRIFNWF